MLILDLNVHLGILIPMIIWFIYAVWVIGFVRKQMGPELDYIRNEDPEIGAKYDCFRRKDLGKWNHFEIYFCALFLLPLRALQFFGGAFTAGMLLKIGLIGVNLEKEISGCRRWYIKTVVRLCARVCLYGLGFYWITRKKLNISDYDPSYSKETEEEAKSLAAPMIVSNHVSFIDIFFHLNNPECPSFLSKAAIKNYPIFGPGASALQTIFVQREDKEKRGDVAHQIQERVDAYMKKPGCFPQILIFPEGTTSNGEYMLSFKKGAFTNGTPLKMYAIKYTNKRFSPAFDTLGIGKLFLFAVLQFWNSVTIYDLGVYNPGPLNLKGEEDWEEYASKVKNVYVQALGLKATDMGYQDMVAYQQTLGQEKAK